MFHFILFYNLSESECRRRKYQTPRIFSLFYSILYFFYIVFRGVLSLGIVNIKHRYYNRAIQGGLLMIKTGEEGDTRCLHDVLLLHIP